MVFGKILVPGHGAVQIMKPIALPYNDELRGIRYFLDDNASPQAYEYGNYEVPGMSDFEPFLVEFCNRISERGLQRKFGLKLQHEDTADQTGWTEYELHAKRGAIMSSDGMPVRTLEDLQAHHNLQAWADHIDEGGFCLGGRRILPGTPVRDIVGQIIAAF
ncbi:hypothetical protein F4776DRAFT_669588 [Hypoxylon sp. NC0597]|nr:hypothetical protein F4776DRAFT_669588 [Hypoxylon sp. NC0597]